MLGQLLKYIPQGIVHAAAREHGVDAQARTYSVWSHRAAMVFVHLSHAFSLLCSLLPCCVRPVPLADL